MVEASGYRTRRKPRWWLIVLIVLLHIAAIFGLARVFAPDLTASVIDEATSLVTVTVRTIEEPEAEPSPDAEPNPDEGTAGDAGLDSVPQEVMAPEPPVVIRPSPVPRAASTGDANTSGARDQGDGTGAGGPGDGTGSGRSGSGQGGMVAVGPSVRSGQINDARDFPVPEGGRQTRFGKSVTVHFTVTVDGRARNCSVAQSSVDAEATARVCPLVIERIRFNPATTRDGTPVEARYGYRVDFMAR